VPPDRPGHAGMYTCGPTVWNFATSATCAHFLLLRPGAAFTCSPSGLPPHMSMNLMTSTTAFLEQAVCTGRNDGRG